MTDSPAARSPAGPLPAPQVLAAYEAVVPGFAERLLSLVEQQAQNRMRLEQQALAAEIASERTGQQWAGGLTVLLVLVGLVAVLYGHETAGVALWSINIVGLATAFIVGTVNRRREREGRIRQLGRGAPPADPLPPQPGPSPYV